MPTKNTDVPGELLAHLPLGPSAEARWQAELDALARRAGYETQIALAHEIGDRLGESSEWVERSFKGRLSRFLRGEPEELRRAFGGTARKPFLVELCEALDVSERRLRSLLASVPRTRTGVGGDWHPQWPGVREAEVVLEPVVIERSNPLDQKRFLDSVLAKVTPDTTKRPDLPFQIEIEGVRGSGARTGARFLAESIEAHLAEARRERGADRREPPPEGRVVVSADDGAVLRDGGVGSVLVEIVVIEEPPPAGGRRLSDPERLTVGLWTWGKVRELARALSSAEAVADDHAATLRSLAGADFGWQERFVGAMRPVDAAAVLRALVDAEQPEPTPGDLLLLRSQLMWSAHIAEGDTDLLGALAPSFPTRWWRARFETAGAGRRPPSTATS